MVFFLCFFQRFSRLVTFGTGRGGTILTCLAGKKLKIGPDGTAKKIKIMVASTGRDSECELSRREGTVQYNNVFVSRRDETVNKKCHDGTGRCYKT